MDRINLVGVWLDTKADCVSPTLSALDKLRPFINAAPTILAGDFNQSVFFDAQRAPIRRFQNVLDQITQVGLKSAWHVHTGEAHGNETGATLYWRWQRDKRYHVDFVFYPPEFLELREATLGSYEQHVEAKISDHVPLTVDLTWIA